MLLLCVLLSGTSSASGFQTRAPSALPFNTLVSQGYFDYFPLTTISNSSMVSLSVSSDVPVSTALMTSHQFMLFNDSATDLAGSLYLRNATTAKASLHEPVGTFYLVLYAYQADANVSYDFQSYPTNPYSIEPLTSPQPTGVASFGILNRSGDVLSYQIATSEVVGVANISSLQAYNETASSAQSNISGATLQLNSVLVVNDSGGLQESYWVQNTPDFVTNASQIAFADNLWNFSVSGYLSNSTLTSSSGGAVFTYDDGGSTGYYYSFEGSNSTYTLPLEIVLLVNESLQQGRGVSVGFGAETLEGGQPVGSVDWFDTVMIHDPAAMAASFFVSGNGTAPDGLYYDTELVFGGEANAESTSFTQMNATLGVFFANSTSGVLTAFPSLYSFGGDTAETADNLQVSYVGNGFSRVTTGSPDYVYLGPASGTFILPVSGPGTNSSSPSQTSSQSSSPSSTTTGSSSQTRALSLSLSPSYLLVALASLVATAMVLALGLATRKRAQKLH